MRSTSWSRCFLSLPRRTLSWLRDLSSRSLRENTSMPTTMPSMPGGALSDASRTSPAFSPKIARSRRSSGESSVSPLGVTLPTRMSPGRDARADAHDAVFVEVLERFLADVRNFARDLLHAGLGVAHLALELLDVERGELVFLEEALRSRRWRLRSCSRSHGMNATSTFMPSASSPSSVAGPSASTWPALILVAHLRPAASG